MLRIFFNKSFNNNVVASFQRMICVTKYTIQPNEIEHTIEKQNTSTCLIKPNQPKFTKDQNKKNSIKNDKNIDKKDVNVKKATDKMNENLD